MEKRTGFFKSYLYIFFFSPHNIIEVVELYVSKMRKYGSNISDSSPTSKTDVELLWMYFFGLIGFGTSVHL